MNTNDIFKIAAYLDEAHEDSFQAIKLMARLGINYIVLRRIGKTKIGDASDADIAALKNALEKHNLSVIALSAEITDSAILNQRLVNVARYFKSPFIQFDVGDIGMDQVDECMFSISSVCQKDGVTPLLELRYRHDFTNAANIDQLMTKHKVWKLSFDPALLVTRMVFDPFEKLWAKVNKHVEIVDVGDFKTGIGAKPLGYGNSRIIDILKDIKVKHKKCWLVMEPRLGRSITRAKSQSQNFEIAIKHFEAIEI